MTFSNELKLLASGLFLDKISNLFGHSAQAAPSEIQDFTSKIDRPAFNILYWMEPKLKYIFLSSPVQKLLSYAE